MKKEATSPSSAISSRRSEVRYFSDLTEYSRAAVQEIVRTARRCVEDSGRFTMALSGGRSAEPVYEELAAVGDEMPWADSYLFWGDERCVAADDPDSNFRMAHQSMLSKIDIPTENIMSVKTGGGDPAEEARDYESGIREFFGGDGTPSFDLILLGLGSDGHTASLFPGDGALEETDRLVINTDAPDSFAVANRITFTFPLINNADTVMFLTSEKGKEQVIRDVTEDRDAARNRYPAARVEPRERLLWLINMG